MEENNTVVPTIGTYWCLHSETSPAYVVTSLGIRDGTIEVSRLRDYEVFTIRIEEFLRFCNPYDINIGNTETVPTLPTSPSYSEIENFATQYWTYETGVLPPGDYVSGPRGRPFSGAVPAEDYTRDTRESPEIPHSVGSISTTHTEARRYIEDSILPMKFVDMVKQVAFDIALKIRKEDFKNTNTVAIRDIIIRDIMKLAEDTYIEGSVEAGFIERKEDTNEKLCDK